MRPFGKTNKFSKRDSGRPEKRDFGGRPEKREFNGRPSLGRSEPKYSKPSSSRAANRDSGFELHEVTCDKCGVKCDVPFKPTNNKPVYCRSCFRKGDVEGARDNNRFESQGRFSEDFKPRNSGNPSSEDLDKINRKLDKIMRALKIE
jgi:CxxC-x17-CxxC domain-containing protein